MGAFIIFEGQYGIGDIIILDDFRGTVRSIGARTTVLEDAGGNLKIVNNSNIRNLQNSSRNASFATCEVTIPASADLRQVEALLEKSLPDLAFTHAGLYLEAPRYLGVQQLSGGNATLKLGVSCREADVFDAQRQLTRDIKLLFDGAGVWK